MAQAKARPKAKKVEEPIVSPDVPGLTPFERMTELTRRIVAVPKSELLAKPKRKKKH